MYHQRTSRYRMPVVFGPSPGPRQGPDGGGFDYSSAPRTVAAVSFLTDPDILSRYLPPSCSLDGEPIVTVEHVHLRNLAWLAGRDYRLCRSSSRSFMRAAKQRAALSSRCFGKIARSRS